MPRSGLSGSVPNLALTRAQRESAAKLRPAPWLATPSPLLSQPAAGGGADRSLVQWVERRLEEVGGPLGDAGPAAWTPTQVVAWLRTSPMMAEHAAAFAADEVDGAALLTLDEVDLLALGVGALGERKRLLHAIAELRRAAPVVGASAAHADGGAAADGPVGDGELIAQRARLAALGECAAKVLANTPEMPEAHRRLLLRLWQQQESAALSAVASLAAAAAAERRRRRRAVAERKELARRHIEARLAAMARADDDGIAAAAKLSAALAEIERLRAQLREQEDDLLSLEAVRMEAAIAADLKAENAGLRRSLLESAGDRPAEAAAAAAARLEELAGASLAEMVEECEGEEQQTYQALNHAKDIADSMQKASDARRDEAAAALPPTPARLSGSRRRGSVRKPGVEALSADASVAQSQAQSPAMTARSLDGRMAL